MNAFVSVAEAFVRRDPAAAARIVEAHGAAQATQTLGAISSEALALLLSEMAPSAAVACVTSLPPASTSHALEHVPIGVAASIVRRLASDTRRDLLASLKPRLRGALDRVLVQPAASAGAVMNPLVPTFAASTTAGVAIEQLRAGGSPPRSYVYVTGAGHRFEGAVSVGDLLCADANRALGDVADREFVSVPSVASARAVIEHPAWSQQDCLAVVDPRGTLLGAVEREMLVTLRGARASRGSSDELSRTASALAEVYGIGLSALFDWASNASPRASGGSRS